MSNCRICNFGKAGAGKPVPAGGSCHGDNFRDVTAKIQTKKEAKQLPLSDIIDFSCSQLSK